MALETGDYYLYAYDLDGRPIGALSPSVTPTAVIVQRRSTEPHKWYLQNVGSRYIITFGGHEARGAGGAVELFPAIPIPPFLWEILPQNSEGLYGIFIPGSGEGWFVDKHSPLVELPVKILRGASSIRIVLPPAH